MFSKISLFIAAFLVFQANGNTLEAIKSNILDLANTHRIAIEEVMNQIHTAANKTINKSTDAINLAFAPLRDEMEKLRNSVLDDLPTLQCVDEKNEALLNIPKNMILTSYNCATDVIARPIAMGQDIFNMIVDLLKYDETVSADYNECNSKTFITMRIACKAAVIATATISIAKNSPPIAAKIVQLAGSVSLITMKLEMCAFPVSAKMIEDARVYVAEAYGCIN